MGKVHGSLARAGKVKAQTPKVPKQQKAHHPIGRAKKRHQYTKRFVSTIKKMAGGTFKKGPNSQS